MDTKIKEVIGQIQKLHEEYSSLCEYREVELNVNIKIPIKIHLDWYVKDTKLECIDQVYDLRYREALTAFVDKNVAKEKGKYDKEIINFVKKCDDIAKSLGVDDVEYFDAIIDNDSKKIIGLMYPEFS